jgi:glycosyltransferase involved in cell wall biosynthesis
MKISVILCTYNRAQLLGKALESVAASVLPSLIEWEVLVVDNNSCDESRQVTETFCRRYPGRFRYFFESKAGKSHALNLGIRESRGDVLAFMDDDVVVQPTWLQNLTAALSGGEWAGVGGRILPEQSFSPPRWIPFQDRYALAPLAVFDPDLEAGRMDEAPFGTNMAFLRRVFEKYGGFRTDLGPQPGASAQKSEDSEFGHRLLAAGERLRYEPSAVVYHGVPQNRLQKKYFLAWWFDKSTADIRAFGVPRDERWSIAGIPISSFRRLAVWTLRWGVAINPSRRFSCKVKVWSVAAAMTEYYRQSRSREINNANRS